MLYAIAKTVKDNKNTRIKIVQNALNFVQFFVFLTRSFGDIDLKTIDSLTNAVSTVYICKLVALNSLQKRKE